MKRYRRYNSRNGSLTSRKSISEEEYEELGSIEQEKYTPIDEGWNTPTNVNNVKDYYLVPW